MKCVDFDDYSDEYSDVMSKQLGFFSRDDSYFSEYKVRITRERARGEPGRILEYGCGIGRNLRFLHQMFGDAEIFGCDISERSLERAREEHPYAKLFLIGRDTISSTFDLIFIANVFHHIAPHMRHAVMKTIQGLLTSEGEVLIFEHNPYNPLTRHMVNSCPFDADAVLLTPRELFHLVKTNGLDIIAMQYALFFPPGLRRLQSLERHLGFLPLGGQHYVHACKHGQPPRNHG
jgi:SAM-dependent methyltransferase